MKGAGMCIHSFSTTCRYEEGVGLFCLEYEGGNNILKSGQQNQYALQIPCRHLDLSSERSLPLTHRAVGKSSEIHALSKGKNLINSPMNSKACSPQISLLYHNNPLFPCPHYTCRQTTLFWGRGTQAAGFCCFCSAQENTDLSRLPPMYQFHQNLYKTSYQSSTSSSNVTELR